MKLLTLDVGNTTVDACGFEGDRAVHLGRYPHGEIKRLRGEWERVVAVSVKPSLEGRLRELFGDRLTLLTLRDIPLRFVYDTPDTLGTDRLLFAFGVKELYTANAVLVMAGTALVVDLLLDGVFMGGFITAGVSLKLRALSEHTEGIPLYSPSPFEGVLGRSTPDCVVGGVYRESRAFIRESRDRWSEIYGRDLPVFITGGDCELFADLGTHDPLILHRAMRRIIING